MSSLERTELPELAFGRGEPERRCTDPDKFGGHHKPFLLVSAHYRVCTACGRVDDNSGKFAVQSQDVGPGDVFVVIARAADAGVAVRWAE